MQEEVILALRGIGKSFGGLRALHDVSFQVEKGSITGLIGPNGSGKSTLFDIISRYQQADTGEIIFAGEPLRALAPHQVSRRGLIRTFQLTRVFPTLTVAENLLVFAGKRHRHHRRDHGSGGSGGPDGVDKAYELLEFVGLLRLADQEAAGMSYGQLKLLEIAQVLMLDPTLLMLDEPLAGINPGLADEIVQRLCDLRDRGMTLVLVEHNLPVVRSLCDSLTVLNGGQVMITGAPEDVLADKNVREAFLGD
jgi:ABC-type branched-subunit amino acid transport system ATPase component